MKYEIKGWWMVFASMRALRFFCEYKQGEKICFAIGEQFSEYNLRAASASYIFRLQQSIWKSFSFKQNRKYFRKTMWYSSLSSKNIQLRVHHSGRETSCDWNRLGSVVRRRRFSFQLKPRVLQRMSWVYKRGWRKGHDWCGWRRAWRGTRSSCQNNLFWKNPKASKPFLLKTQPNYSPVSRAVEKLRRNQGNNIFSF